MVYGAIDLHLRTARFGPSMRRHGRARAAGRDERGATRRGVRRVRPDADPPRDGRRVSGWRRCSKRGPRRDRRRSELRADVWEIRRKVKTDRRDVAALAEANRRGWYRATHRVSAAQRALRQQLRSRRLLVQMRSGTIALMRSLLRQAGYRLAPCSSERVPHRLTQLVSARRSGSDHRPAPPDGGDVDDRDRRAGCPAADAGRRRSDRAAVTECAGRRAGGRADVPRVCR